jgi:hypothetical protein
MGVSSKETAAKVAVLEKFFLRSPGATLPAGRAFCRQELPQFTWPGQNLLMQVRDDVRKRVGYDGSIANGIPEDVTQERAAYVKDLLQKEMTFERIRDLVAKKFLGYPTVSTSSISKYKGELKKSVAKAKPVKEAKTVEDVLKEGTRHLKAPGPILECAAEMKKLMGEYSVEQIRLSHDGSLDIERREVRSIKV